MAFVVLSKGGLQWIADERRKHEILRDKKLYDFASECEVHLGWLQEYYQKALAQQKENSNLADLLKTPGTRRKALNSPLKREHTHVQDYVDKNLFEDQEDCVPSKDCLPSFQQRLLREVETIVESAAGSKAPHITLDCQPDSETSFLSNATESTEISVEEAGRPKKGVRKGRKPLKRKKALTKKGILRTRTTTSVTQVEPVNDTDDSVVDTSAAFEAHHEHRTVSVSSCTDDDGQMPDDHGIFSNSPPSLVETDQPISVVDSNPAVGSSQSAISPRASTQQVNEHDGFINGSSTTVAFTSQGTTLNLPKSLIQGSRALSTSFAAGSFQIMKPRVKSTIAASSSVSNPANSAFLLEDDTEQRTPPLRKRLVDVDEASDELEFKRRRSSQTDEEEDKPVLESSVHVAQALLSVEREASEAATAPLQPDESQRHERKLRDFFTSGTEKIKKALSSLRPMPSGGPSASMLTSSQGPAPVPNATISDENFTKDSKETLTKLQPNLSQSDDEEKLSKEETSTDSIAAQTIPAKLASRTSDGSNNSPNEVKIPIKLKESPPLLPNCVVFKPSADDEEKHRHRTVAEIVQEIERRQSTNFESASSRRSSLSFTHSNSSQQSSPLDHEMQLGVSDTQTDIESQRREPDLRLSDLQDIELDLDEVLNAVRESSVQALEWDDQLCKNEDRGEDIQNGEKAELQFSLKHSDASAKMLSSSTNTFISQAKEAWLKPSVRPKPKVRSLALAAAAAKKEQMEKDRKVTRAREVDRARQLAMRRKQEEQRKLEELRRKEEERARKIEARAKEQEILKKSRSNKPVLKNAPIIEVGKLKAASKENFLDKQASKRMRPDDEAEVKSAGAPTKNDSGTKRRESKKQKIDDVEERTEGREILVEMNVSKIPIPKAPEHSRDAPLISASAEIPKLVPTLQSVIDRPTVVQHPVTIVVPKSVKLQKELHPTPPRLPPPPPQPQYGQKHADQPYELPEIDTDDEDEEPEGSEGLIPNWASSPALRSALLRQSALNPETIFGAIQPVKIEDIFKGKEKRFRPRSSSAYWAGTDRLTIQEEIDYKQVMGYKN